MPLIASNYRPVQKNTLKGFVDITFPETGIIVKECSWHEGNGREWVSFPGKPQLNRDGTHRKDESTGKPLYTNVIEFADKTKRDGFNSAAIKAIYKLLGDGGPKADRVSDANPMI